VRGIAVMKDIVSLRGDLRKEYAAYERRMEELEKAAPKNVSMAFGDWTKMEYVVGEDELVITQGRDNAPTVFSGDEIEELYQFLGRLCGAKSPAPDKKAD
jgi:hypothetical protein